MHYRPEVDGLRAIAIVPVILFHAGLVGFPGGYVGVDVFFVISGYLITTLILEEMDRGRFSFLDFYARRILRIAPTLGLVLAACIPFAWLWMLPGELAEFGKTLASTAVFLSNFTFWGESGYFDSAAELKPLLHTWSLSVEEQFYLLFPVILLLLVSVNRKGLPWILAVCLLLSFGLADWASTAHPSAAYYFIFTRAWQLLIGALLAAAPVFTARARSGGPVAEVGGLVGLLMIALAVFAFDENTPFPGRYAMLPTVGAALVIGCASRSTWIGSMLSMKPVVYTGLLSYGMYMWHQPVLAFARLRMGGELTAAQVFWLCLLVVALAMLTRQLVENPLRRAKKSSVEVGSHGTRGAYGAFFLGTAIVFGMGCFIYSKAHLLHRQLLSEDLMGSLKAPGIPANCFDADLIHQNETWLCRLGKQEGPERFFLLGDSHAHAMHKSFDHVAQQLDVAGAFAGASGCPPLLAVHALRADQNIRNCHALNLRIFEYVKARGIQKVILVARWTYYTDGGYDGNEFSHLGMAATSDQTQALSREAFEQGLAATVERYREIGAEVHLVRQVPQQLKNARQVYGSAAVRQRLSEEYLDAISVPFEQHRRLQSYFDAVLMGATGVRVISFDDLLCTSQLCRIGTPIASRYSDDDHLSLYGVSLLENSIGRILRVPARFAGLTPEGASPAKGN